MAAAAKLIDWFLEHENLVRRMGVMTNSTSLTIDNTMDIFEPRPGFLGYQVLLVSVTQKTKSQGAFFNQLITAILTVWVMTQSTSANIHWPMYRGTGHPRSFPCMAVKTKILDIPRRETYFPRSGRLLMAS
jgi:hypothetical protein